VLYNPNSELTPNRLTLLVNENELQVGEKIWRKLPRVVVPNYYYSREHYLDIFKQCKLVVLSVELPHFNNEEDRVAHNKSLHSNAGLGKAYVSHAHFIIFKLKNGRISPPR
jgi:hypothetical protein